MAFIKLDTDTGQMHYVNIDHIQDFTDGQVWIDSRRFKVTQTAEQIIARIQLES